MLRTRGRFVKTASNVSCRMSSASSGVRPKRRSPTFRRRRRRCVSRRSQSQDAGSSPSAGADAVSLRSAGAEGGGATAPKASVSANEDRSRLLPPLSCARRVPQRDSDETHRAFRSVGKRLRQGMITMRGSIGTGFPLVGTNSSGESNPFPAVPAFGGFDLRTFLLLGVSCLGASANGEPFFHEMFSETSPSQETHSTESLPSQT